jgi:hypothetical protein
MKEKDYSGDITEEWLFDAETERFVRHNSWIVSKRRREVSPGIYESRT